MLGSLQLPYITIICELDIALAAFPAWENLPSFSLVYLTNDTIANLFVKALFLDFILQKKKSSHILLTHITSISLNFSLYLGHCHIVSKLALVLFLLTLLLVNLNASSMESDVK